MVDGEQIEVEVQHSIIHPFELCHHWYRNKPQWFAREFLGGPIDVTAASTALQIFWASIPDTDPKKAQIRESYMARPDINGEADLWSRAYPIILHGDGVPVGNNSLFTLSVSGFLNDLLSTKHCKIPLSSLLSHTIGEATDTTFWAMLLWSLMVWCSACFEKQKKNKKEIKNKKTKKGAQPAFLTGIGKANHLQQAVLKP